MMSRQTPTDDNSPGGAAAGDAGASGLATGGVAASGAGSGGAGTAIHAVRFQSTGRPDVWIEAAGLIDGAGNVTDLLVDNVAADGVGPGAIVCGRVISHSAAQRNFRVDIGAADPAFLPQSDATAALRPGRAAIFQVTNGPRDGKGAALTVDVTITGRTLVLVPYESAVRGGRDWDADRRDSVAQALRSFSIALARPVGWILRSAARDVLNDEIIAEAERLLELWARCEARAAEPVGQPLLLPAPGPAERLLLDFPDCRTLRCVGSVERQRLAATIRPRSPDVAVVEDPAAGDLVEVMTGLFDPVVHLPSGGRIRIEQTAALVAIDVDQGSCPDLGRTNREAAAAVARHLRLRNLAGVVVIDFPSDRRRKALAGLRRLLDECLAGDCRRINGMDGPSPLGLIQFARERRGSPLHAVVDSGDL